LTRPDRSGNQPAVTIQKTGDLMKTNLNLYMRTAGLLALAMTLGSTFAADLNSRTITEALSTAPTLELASKAASLVRQAPDKQTQAVTREVVRVAAKVNTAALVSVVGAIAKDNNEMAALAAGTAASIAPKLAVPIAKAAAAAAPSKAGKVVQAVCQQVPKQYKAVALAVAQVCPRAGQEILDGVAAAVPSLKAYLTQVEAGYDATLALPVGTILTQAESVSANSGLAVADGFQPVLSPPTVGPPFTPLLNPPGEIGRGNNSNEKAGGRNYSAP
jgi:hypothetical protein